MEAGRTRMVGLVAGCAIAVAAARGFSQERPAPLRIGLMPASNSIPLVVAQAADFYRAAGVEVQLIPFSGQLERETALQTGALDGTVSDLINAILGWRHGSGALVTSVTEGNFALLAAPQGPVQSLDQWPGEHEPRIRIALVQDSIVFYLTERMVSRAGRDPARVQPVPVVQLPVRLEMLIAGKVDAACLPEPLATLAVSRGARVLADSDAMGVTPGVLLFTRKALLEKRSAIAAFYRAYDLAADAVAQRPEAFRARIVAGCGFPESVAARMRIPRFRHGFLPSERLVDDVSAWMVSKGLIDAHPSYAQVVDPRFASADARAD